MADKPKNDEQLLDWVTNLREDGQSRRMPQECMWYESIAAYNGDMWSEFNPHDRRLVEPDKPDHKIRLPINLVQPAVRTEYAKLLKNRPIVDCMAKSNDFADLESAKIGDKILYNYVEKELGMPRFRRQMLQWLVICGTGGIFVDYDPSALRGQRVIVDPRNGNPVTDPATVKAIQRYYREKKKAPKTIAIDQGILRHEALSPFQILYDFSKNEYIDSRWVMVSSVYDTDEVFEKWEVEVDVDDKAIPNLIEKRNLERWDLTQGTLQWSKGRDGAQKLVQVHRMFVLPGHRYFPEGAEIICTDTELIKTRKFPFLHGWLPVGLCGHIPMPISQYSMSVIPQIKPVALEVSKTVSQLIENRNLMSNPPWIEFSQNRIKGRIQNKPGARIKIEWMPNVPEPHPVEMPEMPVYVKELVPMMKETILEISGQSEVSQGKVPAGARAGVTIAYLQEEDDTKLGPTVQEYEECMERVAWLDIKVIAEKYDTPRTVRIYKKHSEPEIFDFVGSQLDGVAGVILQAGSALPRSKAAKQQFILDLWDRKLETDPRKVREMLELTQGEPDPWEVDLSQAERENKKMLAGKPVKVLEWHNHPAHRYQHQMYMKSADWDELPAEKQAIFLQHDQEHADFERKQQQAQVVLANMGAGGGAAPPSNSGGANGVNATPQGPMAPQDNGSSPPQDSANVQDYQPQ